MTFTEHCAEADKFYSIACCIRDIFVAERAIDGYDGYVKYYGKMPECFYIESVELADGDKNLVNIKMSTFVGDRQEHDVITVPVDFIDNFSEEKVRVFAKDLRDGHEKQKELAAQAERNQTEQHQRNQLTELMKKFPDMMAPPTA